MDEEEVKVRREDREPEVLPSPLLYEGLWLDRHVVQGEGGGQAVVHRHHHQEQAHQPHHLPLLHQPPPKLVTDQPYKPV